MASLRQEEQAELERVLASPTFTKSPNLARLLRYICKKYWEGMASEVKEYHLAVEALGRAPDFDPSASSVVRVEVHRLREKLKRYYETEGLGDAVIIRLGTGNYIPQFIARGETGLEEARHPSALASKPKNASGQELLRNVAPSGTAAPPGGAGGVAAVGTTSLWRKPVLWLVAAGAIVATVLFLPRLRPGPAAPGAGVLRQPAQGTPSNLSASPAEGESLRIIAGYFKDRYVDHDGDVWRGDQYFHGGRPGNRLLKRQLDRSVDPTLFETYRTGDFSYDVPLKPGKYEVRLYFAETMFGPGTLGGGGEASRIFNVKFNGQTALDNFDPYTDAGGNFIADIRAFKNISPASDGQLHIGFSQVKEEPFVNAIEVLPEDGGRLRPLRIVAQDNTYTDPDGRLWETDNFFSGGEPAANRVPIESTPDPGLYGGERFGTFSYALPVASGRYTLQLYFAETFFGPQNPGKGGSGERIFDVYCNGRTLLENFDIYHVAGGANRALVRTFHGVAPNSQGKILLTFSPVKNYASVNALEVLDESP